MWDHLNVNNTFILPQFILKEGPFFLPINCSSFSCPLIQIEAVPHKCDGIASMRFTFDIQYDLSSNIDFHFKPRTDGYCQSPCVVRNSLWNNIWGLEERNGSFPFSIGQKFNMSISSGSGKFDVYYTLPNIS